MPAQSCPTCPVGLDKSQSVVGDCCGGALFDGRRDEFPRFCEQSQKLEGFGDIVKSAAHVHKTQTGRWATDVEGGNLASQVGHGNWPGSGPLIERNDSFGR